MDGVAGWDLGRRVSSKIGPAATKPAFLSKNKDLFVPNKLKEEEGERERNSESFVSFQVLKETASKEESQIRIFLGIIRPTF